jgi:hypothetical protein
MMFILLEFYKASQKVQAPNSISNVEVTVA